jgi:hypothetical protein
MFASSLTQAFEAATPAACKTLLASGINFTVAVENNRGEWFLLHAEDQAHAHDLAYHWVHTMDACGASCWRLYENGVAPRSFATVFNTIGWED